MCETFVALICCQGNTRQEMIEVEATAKHEIYYRVSFDVSLTATARFVSQTNAYHFLFHEQCFPFVNRSICDHPSQDISIIDHSSSRKIIEYT